MKRPLSHLASFAFLLLVAACGTSISFAPTNTAPKGLQKKKPSDVEVFLSGKPDRPYREIGLLEAQQQSGWSLDSQTKVLAKLRAKAGEYGCDGIIMLGANDSVVGDKNGTTTLKGYRAACIVFEGEVATATTTAALPVAKSSTSAAPSTSTSASPEPSSN